MLFQDQYRFSPGPVPCSALNVIFGWNNGGGAALLIKSELLIMFDRFYITLSIWYSTYFQFGYKPCVVMAVFNFGLYFIAYLQFGLDLQQHTNLVWIRFGS